MNRDAQAAVVLITDRDTGKVLGRCSGPVGLGECPNVSLGSTVPCAGHQLVPAAGTGIEGWTCQVSEDEADGCPLAWLPLR
jgi:hypothetical protein